MVRWDSFKQVYIKLIGTWWDSNPGPADYKSSTQTPERPTLQKTCKRKFLFIQIFNLFQVCGITGRQYTYEQVYTHSQRLGANLRKKLKIQNGDTIGVILPNMPEYLATLIGSLNAGGVISTMNPNYTACRYPQ